MILDTLNRNVGLKLSDVSFDNIDNFDLISNFQKHGLIWFSGVNFSEEEFISYSNTYSEKFYSYRGGAFLRKQIGADKTLLSVTGHEKGFPVPLHGELHYHPERPEILWFYCINPATVGGETTVADGEEFFSMLKTTTQNYLLETQLTQIRTHDEEDWKNVYQSTSQDEVSSYCQKIGLESEFTHDKLKTKFKSLGVKKSPYSENFTFINNILPMTALEDINIQVSLVRDNHEDKLPKKVISDIRKVAKKVTVKVQWQKGDFILIDNRRFLHGRKAYVDKNRKIAVRMCNLKS